MARRPTTSSCLRGAALATALGLLALTGCAPDAPQAGAASTAAAGALPTHLPTALPPPGGSSVIALRPTVLAEIPHDPTAYTQGLEFVGAQLYEGTGLVASSQLRELDPATGAVLRSTPLNPEYFGEGITAVDDRLWQLTWQNGVAIEWDAATLTPLREVPVTGEGWGLCADGDRIIRSDGTDQLHFHDPADLTETGTVAVTEDGAPVLQINELECVDGKVWANIWQTDRIIRIDPATGVVEAEVDASGLLPDRQPPAEVLNGIAHVEGEEFLVTGKFWPTAFRVRFDPA